MPNPGVNTVKFAAINNAAASGDTTLVAAVAGKRYSVISYAIVATGAVSVKFKDGAGTDVTGAMALAANGGLSFAADPTAPAFQTSVGNALVINASGAVQVSGHVAYIEQTR
jgi:hypothetical protein